MPHRACSSLVHLISLLLVACVVTSALASVDVLARGWLTAPPADDASEVADAEETDQTFELEGLDAALVANAPRLTARRTSQDVRHNAGRLVTAWREPYASIARPPDA